MKSSNRRATVFRSNGFRRPRPAWNQNADVGCSLRVTGFGTRAIGGHHKFIPEHDFRKLVPHAHPSPSRQPDVGSRKSPSNHLQFHDFRDTLSDDLPR